MSSRIFNLVDPNNPQTQVYPVTTADAVLIGENETLSDHLESTDNPHEVTKDQVGLGNVDNTSDLNKPISTATQTALDGKVSIVSGKDLSTNDYTTAEKTKLAGIATGAEVNVQPDWDQTDTTADDYIKNKPRTINHGTYDTTGYTLTAGDTHIWDTVSSLDISNLEVAGGSYLIIFTCPVTNATTLTLPTGINWNLEPSGAALRAGNTYTLGIMHNFGYYSEFVNS